MTIGPAHGPIVYGVAGKLTPKPGLLFSKTIAGLDRLTVPYDCLTSEVDELVPKLYSQHPRYPGMYRTDYEVKDGHGLLSELTLIYEGFKNGKVPEARPVDNYSLQTATIPVVWSFGGTVSEFLVQTNLTIQYRAPQTTWTWFETRKPSDTTPRYREITSKRSPWDRGNILMIFSDSFVVKDAEIFNPKFLAAYEALRETGYLETVSDYSVEPLVLGRIWRCTVTIQRTIDPLLNPPTIIQPSTPGT